MNIETCTCLNDIVRQEFGKVNYTNREKVKKLLAQDGINGKQGLSEKKQEKVKYCINCGKELSKGSKKFCSKSCSATYNNKFHMKSVEFTEKIVNKKFCKNCGVELNTHQNKYCSTSCQKQFEQSEYIKNGKNNVETGLIGKYQLSNRIKRYLLETRGCKCEMCGGSKVNPYTKTTPLEIHHKDGNYRNNTEENLQILCPNCHSLTETYKSHNKNGRKDRKKYYK